MLDVTSKTYNDRAVRPLVIICSMLGFMIILSTGWISSLEARSTAIDGLASASLAAMTSRGAASRGLREIPRDQLWNAQQYVLANSGHVVSSTPQVRSFDWTVSQVMSRPGGLTKPVIAVNEQSPGPIVHANLGDRLVFHVQNQLSTQTAIHWHGQLQNGTNHYDGASGITQCGIPPGGSMTYNWTAQVAGTFWWHAHQGEQYTDGLYGALIIHSPDEIARTSVPYPSENEAVLLLSDLYNIPSDILGSRFSTIGTGIDGQPGDEPVPDGGAINGVSQAMCAYAPASNLKQQPSRRDHLRFNRSGGSKPEHAETSYCGSPGMKTYNLTLPQGSSYRLRLINAGTYLTQTFSIDKHNLTVVEVDGISVEPLTVSNVSLAIGERASVIVHLDKKPGAYWIRSELELGDLTYPSPTLNATTLGVLRYDSIDPNSMPRQRPAPLMDPSVPHLDPETELRPSMYLEAPLPTKSLNVTLNSTTSADGAMHMTLNDIFWTPPKPGHSDLLRIQGNDPSTWYAESPLTVVNEGIEVFDLILNSLDGGPHPFHLHGHQFWVMSQGDGPFTGDSSALNTSNPMRRDTVVMPGLGHIVIRFITDNPGVWSFHCHIGWHMSAGLLMNFVSRPALLALTTIPQELRDMCKADLGL